MSGKFSVKDVILDQLETLTDVHSARTRAVDYAWFVGLPLGLGGLGALLGWEARAVGEIVGGLSIFTGLLFGLVVWVFELRIQAAHDPRTSGVTNVLRLIDQLFSNVLYAVLAGIGTTVVVIVGASVAGDNSMDRWWTAACIAVVSHFLMALAMCIKRVRAAFKLLTRPRT